MYKVSTYFNIHAPFYTFHTFQISLQMRVKAEESRSEMQVPREVVVPFQNSTTRTQQHQRHPQPCCAKLSSGVRWPEIVQRGTGKKPEGGAEMLDVEERVLVQGYWQDKTEMWDKLYRRRGKGWWDEYIYSSTVTVPIDSHLINA